MKTECKEPRRLISYFILYAVAIVGFGYLDLTVGTSPQARAMILPLGLAIYVFQEIVYLLRLIEWRLSISPSPSTTEAKK